MLGTHTFMPLEWIIGFNLILCRAVCRDKTKQGVCPKVPRDNKYASCTEDCTSDSDCDGEQKCCFNGNKSFVFFITIQSHQVLTVQANAIFIVSLNLWALKGAIYSVKWYNIFTK